MERSSGTALKAEDVLRLLAGAAAAVRLYPPSSPMREQAIGRFLESVRSAADAGPQQYRVDRGRFLVGHGTVGESMPQVAALAETLHALQVGQLIIAPDVTPTEVASFLTIIGSDARSTRASGGIRRALLAADVRNIAVVEVSLRASAEAGILGLDLTTASLQELAREMTASVAEWARDATTGGAATDTMAEAIDRLEPAARDLAMQRCAQALLLLDEETRVRVLSASLVKDSAGRRMEGILAVVGRMPPAALARLLRLAARHAGRPDDALLDVLTFPPELATELSGLLRPAAQSELERGIPPAADVAEMARDVATVTEEDYARIEELVRSTTPATAAARALATTVEMARASKREDAVVAVAEALPAAVSAHAFAEVAAAADLLAELGTEPALAAALQAVRQVLTESALLRECVTRLIEYPEARGPRMLLEAVGAPGAEAFIEGYLAAPQVQRVQLVPAAGMLATTLAPVASRILRSENGAAAAAVVELLGLTQVRRLLPTIALGLEHLDVRVREAALVAIASNPWPESSQLMQKALGHWDPATRRIAAREIGLMGAEDAVPSLVRILSASGMLRRDYELKKAVIGSLRALHAPAAIPALERLAERRFVFSKKERELRYLAREALEVISGPKRAGTGRA